MKKKKAKLAKTGMTAVVFRIWNSGSGEGSPLALFPLIPAYSDGKCCLSYERVGQHGAADKQTVYKSSRPAKPKECRDLAEELRLIGYKLHILHRWPSVGEVDKEFARQRAYLNNLLDRDKTVLPPRGR